MMDIKLKVSENKTFKLRSSLILYTASNTLLVQKKKNDTLWTLMGGKVKFGESTEQAIMREALEELNYPLHSYDLHRIGVFENVWKKDAETIHEINFIYQSKNIVQIDLNLVRTLGDNQWCEMSTRSDLYNKSFGPNYLKELISCE